MDSLINQYSFVVSTILILAITLFVGWRFLGVRHGIALAGLTFVLLLILQMSLSTSNDPEVDTEDLQRSVKSGQPLLVMLYSDY